MINCKLCALAITAYVSTACAGLPDTSDRPYLSEEDVLSLMKYPKRWDGKTVRIKIYPYDNGFKNSYLVCFELCDRIYADSSPFVIITRDNRFLGYKGDRAVVVNAKYSSACFYTDAICSDNRFGEFTELE